ncbi:MAG: tetratricopeptide repeat protein [Terracidiphilus sp.]|jgi:tetratricopeptide (TPR) repeat protein
MKLKFYIVLGFGCGLIAAVGLQGQSTPPAQQKPPASTQRQPAQKQPDNANPFPEDTNNVPVVPTSGEPAPAAPPAATNSESTVTTSLLKDDSDPVHSPDDSTPDASGSDSGFSSSLSGSNDVNIPDEAKPTGHRKLNAPDTVHQETAKEDEDVGSYELSLKHWKAALSRFQSALVTDPENPEVYWGIAEAQRELGDYPNAKANYLKVMEYDPDSKHGKEAKRLLKDPQLANAPAVSANHPAAQTQPQ